VIALDTNVLVRYLVRDDARQTAAATRLIEGECTAEEPGVVSQIVLAELVWVLDRGYGYGRGDVQKVLRGILSTESLAVERPEMVWRALNEFEDTGVDFADCLIGLAGREEGAAATWTFDRKAAASPLYRLLRT